VAVGIESRAITGTAAAEQRRKPCGGGTDLRGAPLR
jgi:hypothetical protein